MMMMMMMMMAAQGRQDWQVIIGPRLVSGHFVYAFSFYMGSLNSPILKNNNLEGVLNLVRVTLP